MGIDPITSNFIINMTGIGVGSCIAVIAAFSKCFLKSRCTNIKSPCMSCDRDVLSVDSEVYRDSDDSFTQIKAPTPLSIKTTPSSRVRI
jgi:hypothetical protein